MIAEQLTPNGDVHFWATVMASRSKADELGLITVPHLCESPHDLVHDGSGRLIGSLWPRLDGRLSVWCRGRSLGLVGTRQEALELIAEALS